MIALMNASARAPVVAALMLAGSLIARPALADDRIYRWTDEQGNAHYAEGIEAVPERHRAGAVPLGFRNKPAPPPESQASAQPSKEAPPASGGTTIRYTPGQKIMVNVRINGNASAQLMLDTGADRTLISPRALVAAGVPISRPVARGQMYGVTGSDETSLVVIQSLEVGEARVGRMPVMAYEMPRAEGDGLLGRDFLDRFNVSIDSSRGVVTLTPK